MCGQTELISGFIFAYLLLFIDLKPLLVQNQHSGCKFEPFLDNAATSAQPPSVKTWATSRDVTYWRKAGYDRSNRHFNLLFDTLVSSKSFRIWSGHYNNLVFVIVTVAGWNQNFLKTKFLPSCWKRISWGFRICAWFGRIRSFYRSNRRQTG